MDKKELEKRTKKFALEVIRFVADLPKNKITDVMGYQFLKAGTSIGANIERQTGLNPIKISFTKLP